MVVIAIVTVLAAVAVPSYKNYKIQAETSNALVVGQNLIERVALYHDVNGSWPVPFVYEGLSINPGASVYISNDPNLAAMATTISSDGLGFKIDAYFKGLNGIPGYVPAVEASGIYFGVRLNNGIYEFACGALAPNNFYGVPLEYLPKSCSCANIIDFIADGTGC